MESNYAEENISTEQPPPREKAWLQGENGDQERTSGDQTPSCEGPQAPDGSSLLSFSFPKEARLLKRAEFLRVYDRGKRFEGRYMTVFILPNELGRHRAGITATKKGIGNKAHDRNRAKRLLRESFRLSSAELAGVAGKFDWVLNARRSILKVKLDAPLAEFKAIVEKMQVRTGSGCAKGERIKAKG
jgi:ribonuclease P protein component